MILESCIGTMNALVAPLDGAARRPYHSRFMESPPIFLKTAFGP